MTAKKSETDRLSGISRVTEEGEIYPPPAWAGETGTPSMSVYLKRWKYSVEDPEGFWGELARELVWEKKYEKVLEWNRPHARWFVGGKLNASVQCLDKHLNTPVAEKTALVWIGEPGEKKTLSYRDLHTLVNKLASGLKKLGVKRGDRVAIYMPMLPELPIACLACARIGAIHSVVFAGFAPQSLRDRIDDCGASVVITSDGGWRRGSKMLVKDIVDSAVDGSQTITNVVVVKRGGDEFSHEMKQGRDVYYEKLVADGDEFVTPEPMDSEDPLFILYTSGTTGKPKGIFHTHAGYLLGTLVSCREVFDLRDNDIFWCTADIGWITGHSYVIYGPMQNGATQIMYEGAPNYPNPDRFWKIVEQEKVTIFYTAPTAIRAFMSWGDKWIKPRDLSSLRLLGTVGEPINPEVWRWYHKTIGAERCPIVDTWWQTETGTISITPLPGSTPTKPGSATLPFYGIDAVVLDESGAELSEGGGLLAIRKPWPAMMRGIWGDEQRYIDTYWSRWEGKYYFAGDAAYRDKDGYFWIVGRVDDVVNVSGHRIGTAELESAFIEHEAVIEAAVVGVPHKIKGEGLVGFVSLREGEQHSEELAEELREWIAKKIGNFARPERVMFVDDLPKTRSGKIIRRLLRNIATGRELGDVTTLADASTLEKLRQEYQEE